MTDAQKVERAFRALVSAFQEQTARDTYQGVLHELELLRRKANTETGRVAIDHAMKHLTKVGPGALSKNNKEDGQ